MKKAPKALQKGTVLLRVAQPTATLTWGADGGSVSPEEEGQGSREPRSSHPY